MTNRKHLAVGVTGGIGSGKTEVCTVFASLGAHVISADQVAKHIVETNERVKREVARAFGTDSFLANGTLERRKLAARVFEGRKAAARINAIVHPHVLRELRNVVQRYRKTPQAPLLVIEAALIYESGANRLVDYVIAVDAEEETRIRRVVGRDSVDRRRVLLRSKAQMPAAEKRRRADFVIINDADLETLRMRAGSLYNLLQKMTETQ